MHLHEYQAKTLLRDYGIQVPDFIVISTLEELDELLPTIHWDQAVVKVQVHAGGRGKAGGVQIVKNPNALRATAEKLLGMRIINDQTGEEGILARRLLISPLVDISKEYYLSVTIDRKKACCILIVSSEGGMEIEEIAVSKPEKLLILPIEQKGVIRSYHLLEILKMMGWQEKELAAQAKKMINGLIRLFVDADAELIEINPLVLTSDKQLVALDAKMTIDDNALFRQPILEECADPSQLSIYEALAQEHDLAYVSMEGNIGCMVNGAGLAMATMDAIHYYGGSPANFLDVGGGATQEKIAEGFKIILSDPKVKAILVNIFGGIMNCVTLAAGILSATLELKMQIPLVVRMEGTNVEKGKQLFKDSGLDIIIAQNFAEAAELAVKEANRSR